MASSLAVPNYVVGTADPSYEVLTVNGSNLTADITLSLGGSSNFEMSTDLGSWTNSVTLTQSSGSVTDEEVAVRLKAGLAKGNYDGTLTLSSTSATNAVVSLSGSVTGQTYVLEQYSEPATAHGTVTFSPASPVAEGSTVTLTATPAEGYSFTADSWVFYKESGGDYVVDNSISVSENQFTMPSYALYVDGTFAAIAVTGVTLNKTSASIGVGDTETLTATVAPANALNKTVTWTSSNTSVATVSAAGVVTAVAAGSATITATTEDGSFTATCTVTVENVVTFDATKDKGDSPLSKNGVSLACSSGALSNGSEYRLYKNSETTISVTSGKITKIVFTGVSGNPASGFGSQTGWTTDGNNGTWTGTASSVSFTASGAQVRATTIAVTVATTATPTFSVAEGEYSEAKSVAISCATDGATIYYTTDGSTPTSSSTAYSSAIDITTTTTLKAIAIKGGVESAVASATYTMNRPAAPTFDVAEGTFDTAFTLHLSAADGATIYYTTDGSTPTTSSSAYSTGINIPAASTTVKAIAVKSGLTSDVATAAYTYDTRPAPTFTLSATSVDLKVNETSSAVSLTTNSDGAVTFACADAHVTLTGTGNSRTIQVDAAGTYTVNVTTAATSNYLAGAGTITVNVTKKATTMTIETAFDGFDLKTATDGLIEGTVKYNGTAVDGAEVTYSSSDESVATVDEYGVVSLLRAGSTTLTASYAGDAEYEACEETYALVLINTTPVLNETVTFSAEGYGNGDAVETVTKNYFTVVFDKGTNNNAPKYYSTGTAVRAYGGNTFTVSSSTKHIGKIELTFGSDDGSNAITTDIDTYSAGTWTGLAQSVTFTIGGTTGNRRISAIKVTYVESVAVSSAGYATYASIYPLNFTDSDIKAYIAITKGDGTGVTFNQIKKVPANTGVLLYYDGAKTEGIPYFDGTGAEATTGNVFVKGTGVAVATDDGTNYNYILNNGVNGIGFYRAAGNTVAANRAYISILKSESADVKAFIALPGMEDTPTGIEAVESSQTTVDSKAIYNLAGQRLQKLQKGVNIVNGKKVLVK